MNEVITRTVYEIIISHGEWEDYREYVLGIYATKEDAQEHCCYGVFEEEVYYDRTIDPYYREDNDYCDDDWTPNFTLDGFMDLKVPIFINASNEYIYYYYDEYDTYDLEIRPYKVDINVDMSL